MISLADLRAWMGIASGDTTHDAVLADLEVGAVSIVEFRTGRSWTAVVAATHTAMGSAAGGLVPPPPVRYAYLPYSPVEVTAIAYRARGAAEWTAQDLDLYVVTGSQVDWSANTPGPGVEVRISYTHGTEAEDAPALVREVVLAIVRWWWDERARGTLKEHQVAGVKTVFESQQAPVHIEMMLRLLDGPPVIG